MGRALTTPTFFLELFYELRSLKAEGKGAIAMWVITMF
jgi:hypothetical protein